MKKKILLLVFPFFCSVCLEAQVIDLADPVVQEALAELSSTGAEGSPFANFWQKRTPMMDILHVLIKDDDGITRTYVGAEIGTAYEDENFLPGKIFYNDEELGDVLYRLNAYNNEIEIKSKSLDDEKQLALIKNEEVKVVTPKNEIRYLTFKDKKGSRSEGYMTILEEGDNYVLYRRILKKFTPPKAAENSMVNSTPSRFTEYTEYYIGDNESKTVRALPVHKKRTAKLFPSEKQVDIQDYIKTNKPDAGVETDVLALFDFLDTL